ncbi:putative Linear gramicidin synthase subunit C [Streptomyces alboflavus]|uniref:Putative Linear gramicidin synthase subunit C n=1 Tax=Streptomyces alboflavus TaxID=67267 RepID=A0A1Z1WSR1_9ACTN|nr:AMP-binding protein [Streptomyces alboflavus]ARX89465.1 putative Linear gramicidin synthase subunit C [Streptomyces alboflavus]
MHEGRRELTYRQLDAWSDRVASRLLADGLRPEDRVALLMDRSAELVVAQLAVLKAGGAYVPSTPGPPERRRTLLDRAGVSARLTAADVTAACTAPGQTSTAPAADPDRLAYVMFTSGSTGEPKAVAVRHRDVASLATDSRFADGVCDRVLLHSPVAFDAATFEVWGPLLTGGCVVVAAGETVDAALLRRLARPEAGAGARPEAEARPGARPGAGAGAGGGAGAGVGAGAGAGVGAGAGGGGLTALWLTAGVFRLLAQDAPDCFAGLRQVWTGGDVVPAAAVRRVLAACPGLTVVDGYGPTETTTFATSHALTTHTVSPTPCPWAARWTTSASTCSTPA